MGVATTYKQGRSIATLPAGFGMCGVMVTGSLGWRKRLSAGLAALVIIVAGCSHPKSRPDAPAAAAPPPGETAARQLASGDFSGAADTYKQLAASQKEPVRAEWLLRAALVEADLGISVAAPVGPSGTRAALLAALSQPAPREVLKLLDQQPVQGLEPYEAGLFLRTLGLAQAALGQHLTAASNLTLAERYPIPPKRQAELTPVLWAALQRAERTSLEEALHPKAPYAAGWLALLDLKPGVTTDKPRLEAALADWRTKFPNHPAQTALVDELLTAAGKRSERPRRIAVLLPSRGPLAKVAAAVRDGLLAARFADTSGVRPEVLFFDPEEGDMSGTLDQIRNAQADLIIGPLEKDQVDALAVRTDLPAPIVALNTTAKSVPEAHRFMQFALSPEDEATDVANRAWQDGVRRMAVQVANTTLGSRQLQAFTARWQTLGGELVASARFNRSPNGFSESTAQIFGLDASKARAAELRRTLRREVAFEPAPRADIDAVFVGGSAQDAHQLMPQFRYVGADQVAVYGAPAILDGLRDLRADQDLEGLRSGSTAWAAGLPVDHELREAFAAGWREANELQRFFAFGIDAWRIATHLGDLRTDGSTPLGGVTGRLSIDDSGIVRRGLYWAEIREGVARPLESPAIAP